MISVLRRSLSGCELHLISLFISTLWELCVLYLPTSRSMVMYVGGVQLLAGSGARSRSPGAGGDAGRSAAAHHSAHGHQAAHGQAVASAASVAAQATASSVTAVNGSRIGGTRHALRGGGQGLTGLPQLRPGVHQVRGEGAAQVAAVRVVRETVLRLSVRQGSTVVAYGWVCGCGLWAWACV